MKIGLCLSGGGFRAAVFHLGILERLAREELLERVCVLSTVSGGSLATALLFALSNWRWPSSADYLATVLPGARRQLTGHDLQRSYLGRCLRSPVRMLRRGRAALLAEALEAHWDIGVQLRDLPAEPRWLINATTYETGKNWRFERRKMGEWQAHYVLEPRFALSRAVAASAAVPGIIGPLLLPVEDHQWVEWSRAQHSYVSVEPLEHISLWDGGVYENLGLEALFKPDRGYTKPIDFLIVSDASAPALVSPPRYKAPYRLIEVAMEQVRSLRSRFIVNHFESGAGVGSYFRLGNTASYIYHQAGAEAPGEWDETEALSPEAARRVLAHPTDLHRLSEGDFERLAHHGYEIADATLNAYHPEWFPHVPYSGTGHAKRSVVAA